MELITGTAGKPHVTSVQHRAIFEKIIGKGSYILDDNELLTPELQSNQSLRIRSGMLCHRGSISEVRRNTYDEVIIANGSQGMQRIDLVVGAPFDMTRFSVSTFNGDAGAARVHLYAPEFWGGTLYQYYYPSHNGPIRINYHMTYKRA